MKILCSQCSMTSQMAAATQKMKYMMNLVIIIYTLQATMNVIHNMHQKGETCCKVRDPEGEVLLG